MAHPRITVLMPLHNAERFLREAVDSVLAQTFKDFELLIVHDRSTDGSAGILHQYDDARMRVVDNKERIGLTRSCNKGLRLARGEYVAKMDADDVSLPERLEEQVRYLDEHPEVGLVCAGCELIDAHGDRLGVYNPRLSPEGVYYRLTFCNCIVHSSVMFRKDVVLSVGGYNESVRLVEDRDLWYRMSRSTKIYPLPKLLVKYREHPDNVSSRFKVEQMDRANRNFAYYLAALMGSDTFVEAVTPIRTHYLGLPYARITCNTIGAVEKIHEKLIAECPPSINKEKLKAHCEAMLGSYLFVMLRHAQVSELVHVLSRPRHRRQLARTIRTKIKQRL